VPLDMLMPELDGYQVLEHIRTTAGATAALHPLGSCGMDRNVRGFSAWIH